MLAVVPRNNTSLESGLLQEFRQLAKSGKVPAGEKPGHRDGWGMVVWQDGKPEYLGREPTDALRDKKFDEACKKIDDRKLKSHLLLHLRKASVGANTRENTHPFIFDNWAFAHNGTIYNIPHKDGVTDSQTFFEKIMQRSEEKEMSTAIADCVLEMREKYKYSSITFLLSNGSDLFAYREARRWKNYSRIYFTTINNRLVISQEKFFESDWDELENKQMLHVRNSRHTISSI
jgi:predicted glutamine amidotransferase